MTAEQSTPEGSRKPPCGPPKDPRAKKLYVVCNALKRIIKDAKYYRDEEDRLRMKRRERLQRGGEEEVLAADLKHMDDVIKETQDMGPVVHEQFVAAYKALFSMLNDGSFPSHTVTPPHLHSHESSHHPQADDLEDAHSEESVQILKARGELENAEKILLAGNQEDLLREIQGEVRAAVKGRDEVHDEPEEEF